MQSSAAKDMLSRALYAPKPTLAKILPSWINRLNQRDLPPPYPALDYLLSADRIVHLLEPFEIHQPVDTIFTGEARQFIVFVLPCSAPNIVGDADVEHPRAARHDVNVKSAHRGPASPAGTAGPSLRSACGLGKPPLDCITTLARRCE